MAGITSGDRMLSDFGLILLDLDVGGILWDEKDQKLDAVGCDLWASDNQPRKRRFSSFCPKFAQLINSYFLLLFSTGSIFFLLLTRRANVVRAIRIKMKRATKKGQKSVDSRWDPALKTRKETHWSEVEQSPLIRHSPNKICMSSTIGINGCSMRGESRATHTQKCWSVQELHIHSSSPIPECGFVRDWLL